MLTYCNTSLVPNSYIKFLLSRISPTVTNTIIIHDWCVCLKDQSGIYAVLILVFTTNYDKSAYKSFQLNQIYDQSKIIGVIIIASSLILLSGHFYNYYFDI